MSSFRSVAQLQRVKPSTAVVLLFGGVVSAYALQRYFVRDTFAETAQQTPITFKGGLGFTSLRLQSAEIVNHNTKRLRFELPDPDARSGLRLTSSLLTIHRPSGGIFPVIRPYTPINQLDELGYIELLVKKYPNGRASGHLHSLQPGDSLTFSGPIKGYNWKTNESEQINLIAGGAGITPMFQLLQGILTNPEERTKVKLIFGVNTDEDLVLKSRLDAFEKEFPDRFQVVYTISNPAEGSPFRKGYITKELLEQQLVRPKDGNAKIFVCGPPAMEASIVGSNGFNRQKGVLEELGYTKSEVHKF